MCLHEIFTTYEIITGDFSETNRIVIPYTEKEIHSIKKTCVDETGFLRPGYATRVPQLISLIIKQLTIHNIYNITVLISSYIHKVTFYNPNIIIRITPITLYIMQE